jgi:hypothetical protein
MRRTCCFGQIALKFAKNKRGLLANRAEFGVWQRTTMERRAILCPARSIHLRGWLLISSRATPLTIAEFEDAEARGELPDWKYSGSNEDVEPIEGKPSDYGWLDGKIVAVDYTNTPSFVDAAFPT